MDRPDQDYGRAFAQIGSGGLDGQKHAGDVGADDALELFGGGPADRGVAGDAGVGHDDVEIAEGLDGGTDRGRGGLGVGGIGAQREDIGAEVGGGLVERCLVTASDGDPSALGDEGFGSGKSDATVAPGDEGSLAVQAHSFLQ